MVGLRAVALPLAVQLLAALIQIYLLVSGREVSVADRVVTIAVLLIASLQIVVSRPRTRGVQTGARRARPLHRPSR